MELLIKKLSPELINDYLEFFENVGFEDNQEWKGCYCVFYHWCSELEEQKKTYTEKEGTSFNRELAIKMIEERRMQGYLAYLEGAVVGWCNANDKTSYASLTKEKRPERWEDYDDTKKVKLVVCYTIAPDMRRKGISTQLLSKVIDDAKAEGYSYVEAYPGTGEITSRSYHGPLAMYEKLGFVVHKPIGNDMIVRKYL